MTSQGDSVYGGPPIRQPAVSTAVRPRGGTELGRIYSYIRPVKGAGARNRATACPATNLVLP